MKHLLFSVFVLPTLLHAQTYVPFISTTDSSDTWMDINSCQDFQCFSSYTSRYTINGDTTIEANQYAKIYLKQKVEHGTVQSQWCNESINYYEYYYGAIRESGKKIYVTLPSLNPSEYLAYDFNLNVGDTLPSPDGNLAADAAERIINTIDSVVVFGVYRKRFLINNNKYVIEGIGASTGLFNPLVYYPSECYMDMRCYAEYGTPDYFLEDCNMNLNVDAIDGETEPVELVKIVDYMGRQTKLLPNTPLIYIYNDGSTEKVFNVEQ